MSQFDGLADKARQHGDKIEGVSDQAVQQAGDRADAAGGNTFGGQIDQAQAAADERVGDNSQ